MSKNKVMRLADYRPSAFTVENVYLKFDIYEEHTICRSFVNYKRNQDSNSDGKTATQLVLDAENPNPKGTPFIKSVKVGGFDLAEGTGYTYDEANKKLIIDFDLHSDDMDVEIETYLEPKHNAALTGLYQSDSVIVTQCESQGFRRITPFLDRPDVMAKYEVTITADPAHCPVLMANGNKTQEGKIPNSGRHYAVYEDPWPKPSYLFCTANGKLECVEQPFTTKNKTKVMLRVFTEIGESEKGKHALESLARSMKWDEEIFDCIYDLKDYNVVSVAKFTFGAMENKGLNVFRDSLVLASPETATDGDYQRILDVIGHEYFHNYSGNRVTLANWFNISLKEGLTVMREQMFTAYTTSDALERINAVSTLRAAQFATDDSPLAHPVLPQEVESVENCYTSTIYQKGSEVLRMMKVMMGEEKFIEGVKHYFKTYDGQAVTIEEFKKSMEHVSGLDLSGQFSLWYTQSGRPRVKAEGVYDAAAKTYTLTLEQNVPPTQDQPVKKNMMIPVDAALVDSQGNDMTVTLDGKTSSAHQVVLTKSKQTFVFSDVDQEPAIHSLLRGFSAPVTLDPGLYEDQLYFQMTSDSDGFNRWDAGQKLMLAELQSMYDQAMTTGAVPAPSPRLLKALGEIAMDNQLDPALKAKSMTLPNIKELEGTRENASPSVIANVFKTMREAMANDLSGEMATMFVHHDVFGPYSFDYSGVGNRAARNLAMQSVGRLAIHMPTYVGWLKLNYDQADNMTNRLAAMSAIKDIPGNERDAVFTDFYERFKDDSLTIQKWFGMQAATKDDQVIDILRDVMDSAVFNWENPGHVGSTAGGFIANYEQFHRPDGAGYDFIADVIIKMDSINPVTAGRYVEALGRWGNYSEDHQKLMIAALEKIASKPDLSTPVADKVFKSLPKDDVRQQLGLPPVPKI